MDVRKFKADKLFTGHEFAADGKVLVCDHGGKILDLLPQSEVGEGVENLEGLLLPGLVNGHCHLELSHLKGRISTGTGMVPFLLEVMQERFKGQEEKLEAMTAADASMYAKGIVAVGDICNTIDSLPVKQQSRIIYTNFIEVTGFTEAVAHERYTQAVSLQQRFAEVGESIIVPHAPYSVSPALFRLIAAKHALVGTMHNQESAAENEFFLTGTGDFNKLFEAIGVNLSFYQAAGCSSLQSVFPFLQGRDKWILVHNVETADSDLTMIHQNSLAAREYYFCLCPGANQYITGELPPVERFRTKRLPMLIGTDSLASNTDLDIWKEVQLLHRNFEQIPFNEILGWATLGGAKALGIDTVFGSFDIGKTPGIVQVTGIGSKRII